MRGLKQELVYVHEVRDVIFELEYSDYPGLFGFFTADFG